MSLNSGKTQREFLSCRQKRLSSLPGAKTLLLEKQQAGWKSGSNEGPAREAAERGRGRGKDKQHPPIGAVKLITEMRPVVGANRFSQLAGTSLAEMLQHPVLTVKMRCF